MARDDDEMFVTRSINVTPKTTEQRLIVRSDKSAASVTNKKDCARRYWQSRHKAPRSLFATAELLLTV